MLNKRYIKHRQPHINKDSSAEVRQINGRKKQGVRMSFEPRFNGRNGGGIMYVWWQLVPLARSSYCKGPVTFLFESGAGDVEKAHIRES